MRFRLLSFSLPALLAAAAVSASPGPRPRDGHFESIASFAVEGAEDGSVAEIVAATPNGKLLVYTDSEGVVPDGGRIGFVDINDPEEPVQTGVLAMGGSPTSVAITRHGRYALVAVSGPDDLAVVHLGTREIVRRIPLFGQPDCVAISPDGFYAAIAIENERDEDVNDGEMPQAAARLPRHRRPPRLAGALGDARGLPGRDRGPVFRRPGDRVRGHPFGQRRGGDAPGEQPHRPRPARDGGDRR